MTGPRLVGTCLSSWKGHSATVTSPDLVIQSDASNVGWGACTEILYWTYRAELTNDPRFRVNQK